MLALASFSNLFLLLSDLKSANVFVSNKLQVKIGDLGLACLLNGQDTSEGTTVGTMYYMAPERTAAKPYGFPSDMFSLGCILYEMVSHRTPFCGERNNEYALIKRIQNLHMLPIPSDEYSHQVSISIS